MQLFTKIKSQKMKTSFCDISGVAFLAILIGYPLLALLLQIVFPNLYSVPMSLVPSLTSLQGVFADKENLNAVLNSIFIGAAGTIAASILGTIIAFAAEEHSGFMHTLIDALVWLIFFLPSYIVAEGWVMFMQDGGILAQLLKLPNGWSSWFFSRWGVILIMGFSYFPYVYFSLRQGIRNVNSDLIKAGRLSGGSRAQVFRKIVLPLLTPSLLAGASIAFAEAFGDFGLPAAIMDQTQLSLLPYQIYVSLGQSPVNYPAAACLSFLVILISAGAILLQFFWMRKKDYSTVLARKDSVIFAKTKKNPLLTLGSFFILSVSLLVPLGSTIIASLWKVWANGLSLGNWTFANYSKALKIGSEGVNALGRSLEYAFVVAVLTMILGVILAYQMSFKKSALNSFLNILTMSVIAVPGIVLAAAFVFAWNGVWLIPLNLVLYGTPICLGLAFMATYLPYSIRLQLGAMGQLPLNLIKAARVQGAGEIIVLRKIILPLVAGTAISPFFMTFTKIIFELPASMLLYPPGSPTFSVTIQHYFSESHWSKGSALSVIGLIILLAAYSLGRYLMEYFGKGKGYEENSDLELNQEPVLLANGEVTI
ncbi:iron ABC transporter permease [Desulfosporosinus sp. FKB]|uniref:ABC transporter permease n=1 Tax=Desulfosporosinus sp. FKB TaxID=1969835 RepID=UPI001FA8A24C|nr:iron ABC transporter permease [Desulfosporosinus sp. FKB]